jgi:cell division protein FtsQ
MWFKDDYRRPRKPLINHRRADPPLLTLSARVTERKARAHKIGAVLLLLFVLAGGGWVAVLGARTLGRVLFTENERFTIRRLELVSDGKLQPWHIREYAGLAEGQNLFAVDLAQVRRDLLAVPVVASVVVNRKLPDTLQVRIVERVPIARLGLTGAGYPLAVDREGYVLGPSFLTPNLPTITGVQDTGLRPGGRVSDAAAADALKALEICDSVQLSQLVRIRSIDVSHPDYLDVRLARGEQVLLPRVNLDTKLRYLAAILQSSASRGMVVASVDMTVDRNFPVQYQN